MDNAPVVQNIVQTMIDTKGQIETYDQEISLAEADIDEAKLDRLKDAVRCRKNLRARLDNLAERLKEVI